METLQSILKRANLELPRPVKSVIGQKVADEYRAQFGKDPRKIEQREIQGNFMVNAYPDSYRNTIYEIILGFLTQSPINPILEARKDLTRNSSTRKKRKRIRRPPVKV